jgi:hypothetical protein
MQKKVPTFGNSALVSQGAVLEFELECYDWQADLSGRHYTMTKFGRPHIMPVYRILTTAVSTLRQLLVTHCLEVFRIFQIYIHQVLAQCDFWDLEKSRIK